MEGWHPIISSQKAHVESWSSFSLKTFWWFRSITSLPRLLFSFGNFCSEVLKFWVLELKLESWRLLVGLLPSPSPSFIHAALWGLCVPLTPSSLVSSSSVLISWIALYASRWGLCGAWGKTLTLRLLLFRSTIWICPSPDAEWNCGFCAGVDLSWLGPYHWFLE